MKTKFYVLGLYFVFAVSLAGCSAMPQPPTAPSSATIGGSLAAAADGSTLKVTPPAIVSPIDGVNADSRQPTLVWANSNGNYGSVGLAYEIEVQIPDGTNVYSQIVGETPNTGSHKVGKDLALNVVHSWRIRAALGQMRGPWSIWADFKVPAPAAAAPVPGGVGPDGFRTPDPPAGQRLPLINRQGVVQAVASANPAALRNSCQPEGGSWLFMDLVIDALQAIDLRWGYNAKRGNMNDPSLDVGAYHWGAGPSEGSSNVYIIDFIGGHCGSSPSIIWGDVTQVTLDSGNVGRYIYRRPGRR